mmetsp:Transcript_140029/g.390318  ORF Transcript_140029/g.390318 Transcript_140029/m.390318 type:complete len:200 (-) Transcript_140029:302-901(-)
MHPEPVPHRMGDTQVAMACLGEDTLVHLCQAHHPVTHGPHVHGHDCVAEVVPVHYDPAAANQRGHPGDGQRGDRRGRLQKQGVRPGRCDQQGPQQHHNLKDYLQGGPEHEGDGGPLRSRKSGHCADGHAGVVAELPDAGLAVVADEVYIHALVVVRLRHVTAAEHVQVHVACQGERVVLHARRPADVPQHQHSHTWPRQ